MSDPSKAFLLRYPKQAGRSLQLAGLLFPVWALSWLIAWVAIRRLTMNGPIIPVLFARNAIGFALAGFPIVSGLRGVAELRKKHSSYSTGFLRAILGISVGIGFLIVETVTFFLIVSLMLQRAAAMG